MVIKILLLLYPQKSERAASIKRIAADLTITHNLTQVLSNTLMTRYERIVNILKIPLKWKKNECTSKDLRNNFSCLTL